MNSDMENLLNNNWTNLDYYSYLKNERIILEYF